MKFVSKFKLELALAWQALVAPGHGILTDAQATQEQSLQNQWNQSYSRLPWKTVPFSTIQKSKNETDRNGRAVSVFMVSCINPSVCIRSGLPTGIFYSKALVFAVLCFLKKHQILNFIRSKINVLFKLDQISFY
jgi:hypothetical protein